MHYDDCCSYVHAQGVTSYSSWRAFNKSGKRPWNVPSNPDQTCEYGFTSNGEYYETHATHPNQTTATDAGSGWLGWDHFYGVEPGKNKEKRKSKKGHWILDRSKKWAPFPTAFKFVRSEFLAERSPIRRSDPT